MNATILSQTARKTDLSITEATGTTHRVTIDRTGSLEAHYCEAYPTEAEKRTAEETEAIAQAVRFGKYHTFRKRGDYTITPYSEQDRIAYPERVAATALIIAAFSAETFSQTFETAYRQLTADDDLPIEPPVGAEHATIERIEQEIYLDVPDQRLQQLLDVLLELEALGGLRELMDQYPDHPDEVAVSQLGQILDTGHTSETLLDTLSPVRVWYSTDGPTRIEHESDVDVDHPAHPPVCLQFRPPGYPVQSAATFQRQVVDHLRCQLRDCYIGMGLAPPRDFRVRGPGIARLTNLYAELDQYQRYHDPEAIIDWTRLSPIPSF